MKVGDPITSEAMFFFSSTALKPLGFQVLSTTAIILPVHRYGVKWPVIRVMARKRVPADSWNIGHEGGHES